MSIFHLYSSFNINIEIQMQLDLDHIARIIKAKGKSFGFQQIGITDIHLDQAEARLQAWLEKKFHGKMSFMEKHGLRRSRPAELVPQTVRVISARMDYLPPNANIKKTLANSQLAFISRYALGKDYHKLIRKRLNQLMEAIKMEIKMGEANYRVFADSAPVMEKPLAEKAGLGWIGKSTNLINTKAGSWFFLGTIYTDLPLPIDTLAKEHCGSCHACLDVCPTQAIIAPFQIDARRCISYLTIELRESIPVELRSLMGNRIYGCDDCQLVCPWNKFAKPTMETAFLSRHQLNEITLIELFNWTETDFYQKLEGSAIRRIGYECWLRNIAVALGNATTAPEIINALQNKINHASALVREHVEWAIKQHNQKSIV